jgi:hypothetical protein
VFFSFTNLCQTTPEAGKMDFVCKDNPRALIPEGVYEAVCTGYDDGFCFGKCRKLFLTFKIITQGPYLGTELFMAFNMAYTGKIAAGSKYYKTWCLANNWQKPSRNAVMSPRIFKNKSFSVKVKTVKPKYNKTAMPTAFHYSIIEQILNVNTG